MARALKGPCDLLRLVVATDLVAAVHDCGLKNVVIRLLNVYERVVIRLLFCFDPDDFSDTVMR